MYEEDIKGSIVHSRMLEKQGIIGLDEQKEIERGLLQIKNEIETEILSLKFQMRIYICPLKKRLTGNYRFCSR